MKPINLATITLLMALLGLGLFDYFNYEHLNPLNPITTKTATNGLWLRYYWYFGKHSQPEYSDMVARLREHQIKYAYFHVLDAKPDGALRYRYLDKAQKLTTLVHTESPETLAIAWIYVGAPPFKGGVDISKSEVRANLIQSVHWLTDECGFDGVQLDYEFCPNNDRGLVKLIEETKSSMPKGKLLSIATPMWYPMTLWGWNDQYFQDVCRHADQIAVMCYDSYLYLPRFYVWLVSQQVAHVSNACATANPNCKVIFGVPTYEDVTLAHHKPVESLANALRGISHGLKDPRTKTNCIDGIALFADYTTDKEEWNQYSTLWKVPETNN